MSVIDRKIPRVIDKIVSIAVRRPFLILVLAAILTSVCAYRLRNLDLKTSNLDLINQDYPEIKRFLNFTAQFGTPNVFVLVLNGKDPSTLEQQAERVRERLEKISDLRRVLLKVPPSVGESSWHYFLSDDKQQLYLFLQPRNDRSDVQALLPLAKEINTGLEELALEKSGVTYGMTGIPQYALDDQSVIEKDISMLSVLSLAIIFILFVVFFQSVVRPLLAPIVVVVSVVVTLGFVTWYPGHLTLLSAPFAAMIFGIGTDYGFYLVNKIEEYLVRGIDQKEAITRALSDMRFVLSAAVLTTAGCFFVLTASGFLGFEELGIIAGGGLLICMAMMYTLLPALLSIFSGRRASAIVAERDSRLGKMISAIPKLRLGLLSFVLGIAALAVPAPNFDSDYLNLQPKNSEAVRLERQMIAHSDYSPYFAVFTVSSAAEVYALVDKLKTHKVVGIVRSLLDMLPPGFDLRILPPEQAEQMFLSLPEEFLSAFKSKSNLFAVYAYPAENIWDKEKERAFIEQMQAIDSEVTGMPFIGSKMIWRSKVALQITAKLAFLLSLVIVAAHYRQFYITLLSLIPPLLTVIMTQAVMRIFGISFNPLNVMAVPIVFGVAVAYGINIVKRYVDDQGNVELTLAETGRGVLMAALSTLASFGALIFTSHRGLQSFCVVVCIGAFIGWVLSVTLLPWLLERTKRLILPSQALS